MQKIIYIVLTGFLILGFYSCTPESIIEETATPVACCGDDLPILPPPPPPPPAGSN
ncbi:hypothetical protein [uncultured Dokdonia sp.]|uniref:hypothetical protein n=1 Tax=uncultured Dokdonia sp. TaxID=575653 RepID=UPI0026135538|nr:hypothetical protein [uncultured Dokdonia sp.]